MRFSSLINRVSGIVGSVLMLLTTNASAVQPYNMPKGVTEISGQVFHMHMIAFWVCVVIGLVVFGVMFYSTMFHRKSSGRQASQFHESTTVEIIWTVIPFVILIVLAVPATKALIAYEDTADYDMTVKITGYQWMWHYDYLDKDVSFYSVLKTPRTEINNEQEKNEHYLLEVDNELVLPVGKKVRFLITSNDVIHAWWVPELAVKKDAIPGFINEIWTNISKPGIYRGQCAELCGRDHGFMPIVVRALPQEEFDTWVASQGGNAIAEVPEETENSAVASL